MLKPTCYRHPTLPPLAACAGCGRPICSICTLFYGGQAYCPADNPNAAAGRQFAAEVQEQVRVEQFSGPVAPPSNRAVSYNRATQQVITPAEFTERAMRRAWWGIAAPVLAAAVPGILTLLFSNSGYSYGWLGIGYLMMLMLFSAFFTPTMLIIGLVNSVRSVRDAPQTPFAERFRNMGIIGQVLAWLLIAPTLLWLLYIGFYSAFNSYYVNLSGTFFAWGAAAVIIFVIYSIYKANSNWTRR